MIKLEGDEFSRLSRAVHRFSGIETGSGKEYLFETRLQDVLREEGFVSFTELCDALSRGHDPVLQEKVISAVSTKETHFFRDQSWFDLLRFKVFPDLIDARRRHCSGSRLPITIWSAGCSTGQEVYSVLMAFLETVGDGSGLRVRVLGSDISGQAVARASYGEYSAFEVGRGLDSFRRDRYFHKTGAGWRVRDEIRAMATFSRSNLLSGNTPAGPFDIVLCRNVGIYFSRTDRGRLFEGVTSRLRPGGVLLLGASESLENAEAIGMNAQRHLNAHYYRSVGTEPEAVSARVPVAPGPETSLVAPIDKTESRAAFRSERIVAGGGAALPEKNRARPTADVSAAAAKDFGAECGVLASLRGAEKSGLLDRLRPESRPALLQAIRKER